MKRNFNNKFMKLISKSEWFELESPIGEQNIKWNKTRATVNGDVPNTYEIERIVKPNGEIIWFGQATNWVKQLNEQWTVLGEDENVKPTLHIKGENGQGDYFEYPAGRQIFIPCEEPIYETLYKELQSKTNL